MRAVILINGDIWDYGAVQHFVRDSDILIAADGGVRHSLSLNRTPDIVVGDMDSADPALLSQLQARNVQVERHPPVKDQTDLELAIERALREGADEIILLGATGGRLDQTIANVLILAQRPWPAQITLAEGNQTATLLRGPTTLQISGNAGETVSLIPLSPRVTGVTYSGLDYGLQDATIELGSTRGVSNAMSSSHATVSITDGMALIVVGGGSAT